MGTTTTGTIVLPQPINDSLTRFAQLLVPYGLRLQLIRGGGQTLPMQVHRPSKRAEPLHCRRKSHSHPGGHRSDEP